MLCNIRCKILHYGKQKKTHFSNKLLIILLHKLHNVKNHNARQYIPKTVTQAKLQETQTLDVISILAKAPSSLIENTEWSNICSASTMIL